MRVRGIMPNLREIFANNLTLLGSPIGTDQGGLIYGEGIQDENMTLKEAKYDTISSSENGGRSRGFSDFF